MEVPTPIYYPKKLKSSNFALQALLSLVNLIEKAGF
jgi:hypothetical protein